MKYQRIVFLSILTLFWLTLLCLAACAENGGEDPQMSKPFFQDLKIDNETPLLELCRTSYSLEDLYGYFDYISPNEKIAYGTFQNQNKLFYSSVNETFPVECTRQIGPLCCYSIYKVNEGGYFYVFWSRSNVDGNDEPFAYIVTYISRLPNKNDFMLLEKAKSTAQDVVSICTATEFCFTASSGVYTYSLIDDGNIMAIRYTRVNPMKSRDSLEIMEVDILSKEEAQSISYLSWVKEEDLP